MVNPHQATVVPIQTAICLPATHPYPKEAMESHAWKGSRKVLVYKLKKQTGNMSTLQYLHPEGCSLGSIHQTWIVAGSIWDNQGNNQNQDARTKVQPVQQPLYQGMKSWQLPPAWRPPGVHGSLTSSCLFLLWKKSDTPTWARPNTWLTRSSTNQDHMKTWYKPYLTVQCWCGPSNFPEVSLRARQRDCYELHEERNIHIASGIAKHLVRNSISNQNIFFK